MDDQEFSDVHYSLYQLKKEKAGNTLHYKHSPHKSVKLQMAIMYDLLGYKKSIDFEE
jgi:hypothetical protein